MNTSHILTNSNTLVIHPDDRSTDFLSRVYEGKGYDVVTDCNLTRYELRRLIENHDRIIMMGHGLPSGLLNPKNYRMYIDYSFVDLLEEKETISIWCYSDSFFRKYGMKGFHTGMIISETTEQRYMLGDVFLNEKEQLENMEQFASIVNECIERSPEEMKKHILENYVGDDPVTKFNRKNIIVL